MAETKKNGSNLDSLREKYEQAKQGVVGTLEGTPEHQKARNAKREAFEALTEAERQERRDRDDEVADARRKAQDQQAKAAEALADSDPNGPPTQTEPNLGLGTAPRTPSPANQAFERAGLQGLEEADIKKAEGFSRHRKQHGKGEVESAVDTKRASEQQSVATQVRSAAK